MAAQAKPRPRPPRPLRRPRWPRGLRGLQPVVAVRGWWSSTFDHPGMPGMAISLVVVYVVGVVWTVLG